MATGGPKKGPIAWMCQNGVAANLVMFLFLLGGLLTSFRVKQEVFPEFTLDYITVSVPYPSASPEEVEQGIVLAIEDEVRSLVGIKEVVGYSLEGEAKVIIELMSGVNSGKALQDVKNVVDGILSFPEEAEKPRISLVEARSKVISLVLFGDQETLTLRKLAEQVRDSLLQIPGITLAELETVPPLEIHIEISQENLRRYGLTLEQVAKIVNETAFEFPGGGIKAEGGEVLLRTKERRDFASEFLDIPVLVNPNGSKRYLGEIATILEGVEDTDEESFFNGQPTVRINVFRTANQTPLEIAEKVHQFVETLKLELPKGVSVAVWGDEAEIFSDRMQLLLRNASLGLLLVLALLGLFLEPRLAFWVALGIPISIVGSFLFIPFTEASINMISLFAFIVTLGIIVDDAVVIGENVYQKVEAGYSSVEAAIAGTKEMAYPVFFAVLTNVCAFLPLFFIPGPAGKLFLQIPSIVISVFVISLIESFFVLPSHLAHKKQDRPIWRLLSIPNVWFEKKLKRYIQIFYKPVLKQAIRLRYLTLAIGISILVLSLGFILGGFIFFSFIPRIDSDLITVRAILPFGVPVEEARRVQGLIVEGAREALQEVGGEEISRGIYTRIGYPMGHFGPVTRIDERGQGSHLVGVQVLLIPSDQREIEGVEFGEKWRETVGEIVGVDTLSFISTYADLGGAAIDIQLSHPEQEVLEQAAEEIAIKLKGYKGVRDIDSGVSLGKTQWNFFLKQEGRAVGLTSKELARQVRASFYGAEALRQQRGRDEVKVLVRLPEDERETIRTVEGLILQTPEGGEIPLLEAADLLPGRAYTSIKRVDGRRVISVLADVDEAITNANIILANVEKEVLPNIVAKYPGLSYQLEGQKREQQESIDAMMMGMIVALFGIYILLAISFGSYTQPFIVMMSIPFGVIGAVGGHLLFGYDISIVSLLGIVALTGVVINDSLVLVVTANRKREETGCSAMKAILYSGVNRFRPIILTSLTTFFGLTPMIFETSMQARFLVPMAVSLGFGILFATFIILLLGPALYLIIEDFSKRS